MEVSQRKIFKDKRTNKVKTKKIKCSDYFNQPFDGFSHSEKVSMRRLWKRLFTNIHKSQ